jgi:hypothetical protein
MYDDIPPAPPPYERPSDHRKLANVKSPRSERGRKEGNNRVQSIYGGGKAVRRPINPSVGETLGVQNHESVDRTKTLEHRGKQITHLDLRPKPRVGRML